MVFAHNLRNNIGIEQIYKFLNKEKSVLINRIKKLNDYEQELNKCSKCGLCQAQCPIFEYTKNECCVSRGIFAMLLGIVKKELSMSKTIHSYLNKCLKCGKCSASCPAGIDACQIINTANAQYSNQCIAGKLAEIFFSSYIFSNIIKFFRFFTKPFRKKIVSFAKTPQKVLYFKGCVNEISPITENNLTKILKNCNIEIIEKDFECCGLPLLSEGCATQFQKNAQLNIEKIKNSGCKIVVTDCASCQSTLLDYEKYIEDFKWDDVKFINWGEIIAKQNTKFKFKKHLKVTFHKPCHLKNDDFIEKILKNCENIEYIKMENYDDCCGFAGSFAIKNKKISQKISHKKALNIRKTETDYVITTCPSCILGLYQGLFKDKNYRTKPITLIDFLAKAKIIKQ